MAPKVRRGNRDTNSSLSNEERFFHRKHLVAAFWGLVVGIALIYASVWYSRLQGPQQVSLVSAELRGPMVADPPVVPDRVVLERSTMYPSTRTGLTIPPFHEVVGDLGHFARSACPASMLRQGESANVAFAFFDADMADSMPEILLRISRPARAESIYIAYEAKAQPSEAALLPFPAPHPGHYTIEVGFYLSREYASENRTFWRRTCPLNVRAYPT